MLLLSLLSLLSSAAAAAAAAAASSATLAYIPRQAPCPADFQLVRQLSTRATQQTLSTGETAYIQGRTPVVRAAFAWYAQNVQAQAAAANVTLPDYVGELLGDDPPTLGIATSGGGYRAAIFGAGVLDVLDARSAGRGGKTTGLEGILQAATYLAGLSGGSWLVGSLAQADFPPLPNLVFGPASAFSVPANATVYYAGWESTFGLTMPTGNATLDTAYAGVLLQEIAGKYAAGFPVSFNDFWARALARHFVRGTNASDIVPFANLDASTFGAGVTLSSLVGMSTFVSHEQPFPIITSDIVSDVGNLSNIVSIDGNIIPLTNPILEFNAYETGSWDPLLSAFTPTQYLGTTNQSTCTTNFDQLSYIQGSSSDLFNEFNVTAAILASSAVGPIIAAINQSFPTPGVRLDSALIPNPFFGMKNQTFIQSNEKFLTTVDGGEDGEVVPVQPLLVKARKVEVIFAIDATNDFNGFSNGDSLINAQNRTSFFPASYTLPPIANQSAFAAGGLATRPTFFGCDTDASSDAPLVIYLANGAAPRGAAVPLTNTSTTQDVYPPAQIAGMFGQITQIATQGVPASGEGVDAEWPACLACAIADRSRRAAGVERSGVCATCMARYCWSG